MPRVNLPEATEIITHGGLVGLPTETVYGLGADALDAAAVAAIFATKGRPSNHPLILHAREPARFAVFDARAERLVRFWPGPLTLILPRRPLVPLAVTGGRESVAVRVPAHPLALALLDAVDRPIAAPSANRFGEVSPTTADHVLAAWPSLAVLDGGPCAVGLESTIVDLTGPQAAILRPGFIDAEALGLSLGPATDTPAPGTLASHYAPRAKVILSANVADDAADLRETGLRVGVMEEPDPIRYAQRLYAWLRELDDTGVDVIVAARAPDSGIGIAINDRLTRAAR